MGDIQSVPNLIQGVSQQAPQQRRDSQCEAQFDCFNSPSAGASARPPVEFVKLWPGRDMSGSFFHTLSRGDERYVLCASTGGLGVVDLLDGTDCTVVAETAPTYLTGLALPRRAIRAQTIEDTTFLANRSIRPTMAAALSPAQRPEAIVFVRSPAFVASYSVSLYPAIGTPFTAAVSTPAADSGAEAANASTTYIASQLHNQINGANGFVSENHGSSLLIYRPDGQDFAVVTVDSNGDDFMYAFKGSVSAYSKLPRKGVDGVLLKVQGESRTKEDDYYVRFEGPASTGIWAETVGPGVPTTIDPATMPHILVQTAWRQFAFRRPTWSSRIAGDTDTAKQPSFIGKELKDLFYHQSRLAFLTEGSCVWSKTRFPYTFFPDTVQTALASAPVDITLTAGGTHKGAALLDFAVQINESLHLWAPQVQFRVSSGTEPFKQDTVEAAPSTSYEYAQDCAPLALGTLLYVPTEAGRHVTIRSLEYSQGRPVGDLDVTAHIPSYIPAGIRGLAASDTLRCIFVYTSGAPDCLYLYNFLLQDRDYVQSAWNTWRIPGGEILWAGVDGSTLHILQQRPEGTALLRVNLADRLVDPIAGAAYRTRLDMLVSEAGLTVSYDPATDRSTFTLPYVPTGPRLRVVTRADLAGGFTRGREFEVASVAGSTVAVEGDLRGYQFYVGQAISAERTETTFFLRSDKGVDPTDRLTVERFRLEMAGTGYTRVEVRPEKGPMHHAEFSGRRLGDASGTTGTPAVSDTSLDVKVGHLAAGAAITIINDSFLPSSWQTAAYEYSAVGWRGQR